MPASLVAMLVVERSLPRLAHSALPGAPVQVARRGGPRRRLGWAWQGGGVPRVTLQTIADRSASAG